MNSTRRDNGESGRDPRGSESAAAIPELGPKRRGYGLPCAKCRAYYAADQTACPLCKATERVSSHPEPPVMALTAPAPEDRGEDVALQVERERFLREFKSQLYAQHAMREGLLPQVLSGIE